jgi:hypothetical protein
MQAVQLAGTRIALPVLSLHCVSANVAVAQPAALQHRFYHTVGLTMLRTQVKHHNTVCKPVLNTVNIPVLVPFCLSILV